MPGLKLDGSGFDGLGACPFAATAESAPIFAALNAARLFVLGVIVGGSVTLLGRGRGFAAAFSGILVPVTVPASEPRVVEEGVRTPRAELALRVGVEAVGGADCQRAAIELSTASAKGG
ncbi:hypothetical protein P691DRAFT_307081 [Macrolepiota fuliginosa MF-IS2]|uniref:Uncharacterized protein n=1 Tax=Macrolepiota fuliginosa MF-IS2 TaxID=1400762 RepID=A0A9P5X7V9_9AGAR|nr:hypothetical protein P691DRAFT_307081 [Macrolepiota fuliginosa MF-IS2]